VLGRIAELESDAGGAESLSAARRSLIRHAAWLDAVVETHELRLAGGEQIDSGAYTQSLNSLIGLLRLLGLERQAKRGPTLREIMDVEPADDPPEDDPEEPLPESPGEPVAAPEPAPAAVEAG
ncbi:MAG: hypothetical protein ACRET2_15535, partial [Steroidobacteraceae bacterium]